MLKYKSLKKKVTHLKTAINWKFHLWPGTPVTLQQSQRVIHFGWDINPILSSNSKVPLTGKIFIDGLDSFNDPLVILSDMIKLSTDIVVSKLDITVADGGKSLVYIQQLLQKFPMITTT